MQLDEQKEAALKKLEELVPGYDKNGARVCLRTGHKKSWLERLRSRLGCALHAKHGKHGHDDKHHGHHGDKDTEPKGPHLPASRDLPLLNPKVLPKLSKVMDEIRGINKKLQFFEGGFISEEGIKVSRGFLYKSGKILMRCRTENGTSTKALRLESGSDTELQL